MASMIVFSEMPMLSSVDVSHVLEAKERKRQQSIAAANNDAFCMKSIS